MKRTININLAGYPFTIDEDAYSLLKDYLDTIRYAFETSDDTGEIANDIEARISEILIEANDSSVRIITLEEISDVIERIGRPTDFIDVETSDTNDPGSEEAVGERAGDTRSSATPPPYNPNRYSGNSFTRKRMFRDPQNAMLGGVCSGLAYYFNIDVTILRLITILLFFLSATIVAVAYIILWIVLPVASTPLQRMQMMGEDTTVENIGRNVTGNFQDHNDARFTPSPDNRSGFHKFLSTAFSILSKCLIILGLIIGVPILVALAIGLFGCVIALFVICVCGTSAVLGVFNVGGEELFTLYTLLAVLGGIVTIGIPLWLLVRKLWGRGETSPNPARQRAMLIVWLCGIALLSVFTVKAYNKAKQLNYQKWTGLIENVEQIDMEDGDVENIEVNSEGITIKGKTGKTITINRDGIKSKESSESEEIIVDQTTETPEEAEEKISVSDEGKAHKNENTNQLDSIR
ncbi:MAG: PspC domain-containing protein [Muribaculaceae bacterium]|nr:PspC domain-containing protein [Muribaculaceae bacterium]